MAQPLEIESQELTICAEVSASNAITFSSYILVAAGVESTTWKLRGVAIAGAVFSVGIHIVAPRPGRWIQDILSAIKLFTLFFIVCCGFAALAGNLRIDKPHNFTNAFEGTSNSGYNIGTAILNVIFSYNGYDNVNAVSARDAVTYSMLLTNMKGAFGSEESQENTADCSPISNGLPHCLVHLGQCCICQCRLKIDH